MLLFELDEHALGAFAFPATSIVGMLGHLAFRAGWFDRQDTPEQQAVPEAMIAEAFVDQ